MLWISISYNLGLPLGLWRWRSWSLSLVDLSIATGIGCEGGVTVIEVLEAVVGLELELGV